MYIILDPKHRGVAGGERGRSIVHRLGLFDKAGAITHIISQSDLVRFLDGHVGQLGPLGAGRLVDLGLVGGPGSVEAVHPEMAAIDAMK